MNTAAVENKSHSYFKLRVLVHKNRWLLRSVQMFRAWFILGPLREYGVWYFRRFSHTRPIQVSHFDLFPNCKVEPVVKSLNERGYATGWKIPQQQVAQIVKYAANTRFARYWNPHRECQAIDLIARNEKIIEIARQYIGAEPILWLTQLKWSLGPSMTDERAQLLSSGQELTQYDGDAFHYDALDFKSLTIFIYLTDVDPSCGPHVLIERTHRTKRFSEIRNIILDDIAAHQSFGDRIKMIVGQQGTVLFEETSSFHKASRCHTMRLLLSIDYVLQRKPPPDYG